MQRTAGQDNATTVSGGATTVTGVPLAGLLAIDLRPATLPSVTRGSPPSAVLTWTSDEVRSPRSSDPRDAGNPLFFAVSTG